MTFAAIVALAGITTGPDIKATVTYSRGDDKQPKGSLVACTCGVEKPGVRNQPVLKPKELTRIGSAPRTHDSFSWGFAGRRP